jgi:hypothetical protein
VEVEEKEDKASEEVLAVLIVYWYGDVVIKSLSAIRLSTSGNVIQSFPHRLAAAMPAREVVEPWNKSSAVKCVQFY